MPDFAQNVLEIFDRLELMPAYPGSYDPWLVATSVLIAILAAFVALTISSRINAAASRRGRWAWASAGALSMGGGIWSMHFIGMLAFSLPCGVSYRPLGTILSMIPGILASGVALSVIAQKEEPDLKRLSGGAVLMGAGIGAMHYSGMAAMVPDALVRYDPWLVAVSVVVAVVLAFISLGIRFSFKSPAVPRSIATLGAASVMGCAVAGMHYTAMQASIFYPAPYSVTIATDLPSTLMALFIAAVTTLIATVTLVAAFAGRQNELVGRLKVEVARRRALEQAAEGGRARLQAIFDAVSDAIVTIDRRGRITQWSSGAQRIFGYLADEVCGVEATLLLAEANKSPRGSRLEAFLDSGVASIIGIERELAAVRKNGSEFPVALTVNEVHDGEEVFFTGILRDITERKRNEAELVRAREAAEAANLAKSQFLATMSHEIRTPMNGVLGMANLLSSTPLNDRQRHLIENLMRSGHALVAIINDILDFEKIEAGHFELFRVPFEPREVIAELADLMAERCAREGLELVYLVAEDVPTRVVGDPVRLRQILVNLAGNAIKFTERGEILVELGLRESASEEVVLGFSVKDTGIGIAPDQCAVVFESFHQVDGSMTRARGGSGLGLAITKQLVELMGGTIGVESRLGQGSRFWFTVRFDKAPGEAESLPPPRQVERLLRALLVDANATSAGVISDYLSTWKIDATVVATANQGEAAWQAAAATSSPYDVAIIDVKGLGAEGIGLARRIRSRDPGRSGDSDRPPTETVLLAGLDSLVTDESLDTLGVFASLLKPVRPSELFDCLATIAAAPDRRKLEPYSTRKSVRAQRPQFDARILVVEDNAVNQEVATGILEAMGCHVVTAPNGQCAVRLFTRERFDLILMDCEMPIMDGLEATRRIREIERLNQDLSRDPGRPPHTTIVALTAHALAEVREKCLQAGMDDFLVKPFEERQMSETLRQWLAPRDPDASEPCSAPTLSTVGDAPAAAPVIDGAVIEAIRAAGGAGGDALLERVVAKLAATAPGLAQAIHGAAAEGDAEALWRTAHSLKSSAGALGATQLSRRCAEIEAAARNHGVDGARGLLEDLDGDLADATAGLRALVGAAHELA